MELIHTSIFSCQKHLYEPFFAIFMPLINSLESIDNCCCQNQGGMNHLIKKGMNLAEEIHVYVLHFNFYILFILYLLNNF